MTGAAGRPASPAGALPTGRGARIQSVAAALTLAAMVAYPLNQRRGRARRVLTSLVVGGLHATTSAGAARRWGAGRAALAGVVVTAATGAVEHVGQRFGRPFGRYTYATAFRPQVAGVPAVVPLAWFAMALPARETAHAALADRSGVASRIGVGAAALTAWDLFLDPQMVGEGYWRWAPPGRYRGIPLRNYGGWFLTGLGVMALLELVVPPTAEPAGDLVAEYGTMAAMETVGFAAFFGDRLVALVGGAAMLPIAAVAIGRSIDRVISPAGSRASRSTTCCGRRPRRASPRPRP